MKATVRMAQLVAVFGTAVFIWAVPAIAQDCPEFVGSLDLGCTALDVALSPGHAFVACDWGGLVVVDVSDPSLPAVVGEELLERAQHVAVFGEHAYVVRHSPTNMIPHGFNVVDIGAPDDPFWTGWLSLGWTEVPGVVAATEGYAYVASGNEVLVIDVSDPYDPTPAGALTFSTDGEVKDVAVAEDHAYVLFDSVVNDEDGLYAFDVTDPWLPNEMGCFLGEWERLSHVAFDTRGYAYVTSWGSSHGSHPPGSSLVVVDVADPEQLIEVGDISFEFSAFDDLAVSGGYAYVCDSFLAPIRAINVSNPSQPTFVGLTADLVSAESVAAVHGYVHVADGDAGLTIFRECGPFYDGFDLGNTSAWSAAVP